MSTTLREVNVTFSDDKVAFSGPGISDNQILIPSRNGQIVLRLKSSGVRFPTSPIQWTVEVAATPPATGTVFQPAQQPSEATVLRKSDTKTEIHVLSPRGTRRFSFFVLVETPDGKFFGTDPTIVTMRPEGSSGNR